MSTTKMTTVLFAACATCIKNGPHSCSSCVPGYWLRPTDNFNEYIFGDCVKLLNNQDETSQSVQLKKITTKDPNDGAKKSSFDPNINKDNSEIYKPVSFFIL